MHRYSVGRRVSSRQENREKTRGAPRSCQLACIWTVLPSPCPLKMNWIRCNVAGDPEYLWISLLHIGVEWRWVFAQVWCTFVLCTAVNSVDNIMFWGPFSQISFPLSTCTFHYFHQESQRLDMKVQQQYGGEKIAWFIGSNSNSTLNRTSVLEKAINSNEITSILEVEKGRRVTEIEFSGLSYLKSPSNSNTQLGNSSMNSLSFVLPTDSWSDPGSWFAFLCSLKIDKISGGPWGRQPEENSKWSFQASIELGTGRQCLLTRGYLKASQKFPSQTPCAVVFDQQTIPVWSPACLSHWLHFWRNPWCCKLLAFSFTPSLPFSVTLLHFHSILS